MRGSRRNHDHVPLAQMVGLSVPYIRTKKLAGARGLAAYDGAASHERRLAINHVNDVGLFLMHLHLAWASAVRATHQQILGRDQRSAFGQRGCNFFVVYERRRVVSGHQCNGHREQRHHY